uniref:Hydroxyproline O-arabinosyltransferase-like domain-containing protein n=1 Tax=Pinguiococcus pyrenoidosus TaxID=172671 RepID=A0A7R9U8H9_9STRA|mmetsp:Transcript_16885/g.64298  ORF Transcript_16885/g.64298 Transcript_16885/m.64298 type:complete len:529 (+) Transcript_16885:378-1964(+)
MAGWRGSFIFCREKRGQERSGVLGTKDMTHLHSQEELELVYLSKSSQRPVKVTFYQDPHCRDGPYMEVDESDIGDGMNLCSTEFTPSGGGPAATRLKLDAVMRGGGIRVEGPKELDLYSRCDGSGEVDVLGGKGSYHATVMPMDGCTKLWDWPATKFIKLRDSSVKDPSYSSLPNVGAKKLYNVVFSAESSEYFYYQAMANLHAFTATGNDRNGRWTRALTCAEPDDAMHMFPTIVSKRHAYSRRYSPLNKADALMKWFAGPSAPTEEVIIVIDPDNWLTADLTPIAQEVKKGAAIANGAWYNGAHGRRKMHDLWTHLCDRPEDPEKCMGQLLVPLDLAAVPYFVQREDLAVILPRWKRLIIKIKELCEGNEPFKNEFKGLQITWGAEMLAYNFAAAEAGIRHDLRALQVRDVDPEPGPMRLPMIYMIHMGRAWFPWNYEPGKVWEHTEGRDFKRHGRQVWCKCNKTAAIVRPWPIPDESVAHVDYVSRITLTYLHDSFEEFGAVPRSKYRKGGKDPNQPGDYHLALP